MKVTKVILTVTTEDGQVLTAEATNLFDAVKAIEYGGL